MADLHKKIKEAFEVFDHETNNTVDVRFGNIYCCCYSQLWIQVIDRKGMFSPFLKTVL